MEVLNPSYTNNIDFSVRNSVRYTLANKMMDENFMKWISLPSSMNLIQKLIEDCKKPNISLVKLSFKLVYSKPYFYD